MTAEEDMVLFMTLRVFTSGLAHSLVENCLAQGSSPLEALRVWMAAFDTDNDTNPMD